MTDEDKAEEYYEDNDEIFGLIEGIAEIGDYDDWELAE